MIQPAAVVTTSRFETTELDRPTHDHVAVAPRLTSWSAVIAGAFAAMSMQVIFALLGSAIGLSVIGATADTPERGLSIAAGIWWLLSGLASLGFGGWLAGRLSGSWDAGVGGVHGFLGWCTVTVLSAVLLVMAGGSALGGSLGMVGNAMAANTRSSMSAFNDDRSNDSATSDSRLPTANPDIRLTESERKEAAKHAAGASWWTLLALVLGATVATVGGRMGTVRDESITPRRVR